ncbi:MAG: cupin domain-containing protein [Sphaerochaetaceae bacterium]|nr:cupin domain-containing protein [Sphaerochaetaceae bacterium]MDC7237529.1 cupin domain-containing protein [Sphaerochaetaceae bacterium]MDC7242632.1 cupin domain-containing protein [Sphaerochaetaceae bacterium]MDC7249050.1 cupin domain-containing protein [Sphaerochaetaceae bacterium]
MVIKNENQKIDVNVKMRGGTGEAIIKHIIDNRELCHSRLFSTITLKKGCSIGTHTHLQETEYYYILSGEGVVTEKSVSTTVKAGDVVITGDQESHSIENKADEDLVFIALILLND